MARVVLAMSGGAAALLVVLAGIDFFGVYAGTHEQADHVVSLPLQQHGRRGAIHPATHC